ncbi:amidohydrolase family protein [Algoriphagus chordae]|uniref:Imidazolonepropionase-like amidohydrolase n=1 Tax=Algoriphagus chordae TaxID=237019 RepID=A0A2W7REQ9_9BACT|nr:amidohydrolase family protein [Algoriphagus chordae]PZX54107.1 imidazolonepropionase-like amidohydrolase [Algoriphagus chordae]
MKLKQLLLLALIISGCQTKTAVDLVIKNATLLNIEEGSQAENRFVFIAADSILEVGDASLLEKYQAKQELDAAGKFLMPGLWDNHVHFGGAEYIDENEQLLPLYLAFGVTTVRDAAGDISLEVLKWRDEINSGKRIGPKILTSGPKIEGIASIWPGDLEVGTEEELNQALDSLDKLNIDFVKITDNTLKPELFLKAVELATARGYSVSGHIPAALTLDQVSKAGQKTVEHLSYMMRATTPLEAEISEGRASGKLSGSEAATLQAETYSDSLAFANFQQLAKQGTGIVPTLLISYNIAYLDENDFANDTILNYLGPKLKESYQWRIERMAGESPELTQARKDNFKRVSSLLPMIQKSGMKIMAGTDAGYLNTYDFPGLAIHLELQKFVEFGLTPQQALTASVINGPDYFGITEFSAVKAGKKANLIVLDRNPLEDISATLSIQDVIKDGKVYTRTDLDKMLAEIKTWVANKEEK